MPAHAFNQKKITLNCLKILTKIEVKGGGVIVQFLGHTESIPSVHYEYYTGRCSLSP